ncbi:MAG: ATP-binding protein [Actinobacteria bacterium]|nr:MAG: ATP-binding protein [Actinomycetota bacterium]
MTNLELTLEPVPDSIPQARQTLDRLADAVEEPLLENLRLLVSEVVTNSIRHGEGFDPIELRVSVRPLVVRVEVEDRGPGFEPRLTDDGWRAQLRMGAVARRPSRRSVGRGRELDEHRLVRARTPLASGGPMSPSPCLGVRGPG